VTAVVSLVQEAVQLAQAVNPDSICPMGPVWLAVDYARLVMAQSIITVYLVLINTIWQDHIV
jgi:hypothetical protein